MDELRNKYNNFIKLCLSIDPNNDIFLKLEKYPVEIFIMNVKEKNKLSNDEIELELRQKAQIENIKLTEDQENKFKRYISYFLEISKL